jgi:NADPH-dependent glutamate synthase beta subunit-like oxidoreductase
MELGPADESGRPRPVPIKGSEFTLKFDVVLEAYGEAPDYSLLPGKYLDEKGTLKTHAAGYSLGGKLFAGGDFRNGPATVVKLSGTGVKPPVKLMSIWVGRKNRIRKMPARHASLLKDLTTPIL